MTSSTNPRTGSSLSTRLETKFATRIQDSETKSGAQAVSSPERSSSVELQRHGDLWFKDGSVVLRAENMLFLVHMSQLARHSVCFSDMFSMPQPKRDASMTGASPSKIKMDDSTEFDRAFLDDCKDCSVVYLHDTAEDLANLLAALYDGPHFGNNDNDDFRMVSGILRLSTKYIIDSLRAKALAHISVAWPSTLKGWDAREDLARSYELDPPLGGHLYPSSVAVINLAREVDAPSLLPSAFYDLSRYSFSQIFEPSEDEPLFFASPSTLSLSDMQKLSLGKESSHNAITALIQAMGRTQFLRQSQQHSAPHPSSRGSKASLGRSCVSAAACRKDFSELVDLATQHYLFDKERGCLDPLYVAEELGQLKSAEFSECKACARALEAWAAKEREKMWKLIPLWFRLEGAETVPKS